MNVSRFHHCLDGVFGMILMDSMIRQKLMKVSSINIEKFIIIVSH